MFVVGGLGSKHRDIAIQHVKTVLFSVAGIVNVYSLGNVPKICFVSFSAPGGMRDFIYHQKYKPNFGRGKMWASPSKSTQDKKYRTILGTIKRSLCEDLKRSSDYIIDGPSKAFTLLKVVI